MSVLSEILRNKIVAIIRGADPADVLSLAEALMKGGVNVLEVALNSPNAISVIENLSAKLGDSMLIGAGTVLDGNSAKLVINAGAKFIVSPNVNVNTIQVTKQYGAVSIPGAYTPTEIVTAYEGGGDIIKIFPAPNADYLKALRGPLPHIPMMPTGGITLDNIREFQKAGAAAYGIGTSLVDTNQKVTEEYLRQVTENAGKFVAAIG